jgi:hypothetical protein
MRLSILTLFSPVAERVLAWAAGFTVNLIQQRLRLETAQLQREQLAEAERLDKEGYPEVAQQLREEALDMGTRPGAGAHSLIDELIGEIQPRLRSSTNDELPSPEPTQTGKRRRGRPPKRQPDQSLPPASNE